MVDASPVSFFGDRPSSLSRGLRAALACVTLATALSVQTAHAAAAAAPAPVTPAVVPVNAPADAGPRLTLEEAIRLALQKNQSLRVSEFSPKIARANVLAEYGRFDPSLRFERSYTETERPLNTTPQSVFRTQTDAYALSIGGSTPWGLVYSIGGDSANTRNTESGFKGNFETFGGVRITQPLLRGFGFGANLASLRIAKADRRISDWQHRQTVMDVVTGVILVYNTVLQARENVRITTLSRNLTGELVRQNEAKNRVGAMSDADVLQARARLATREENILNAERSARDAENQLRQLIGENYYPIDGPALTLEDLPLAPAVTLNPAEDLKHAYDLRPDYQAARVGVDRRRATSALANNQLLPTVNFVGSYGHEGVNKDFSRSRAQVRAKDARSYSAGIVVNVPLTFTEGRGRARAARFGLQQSEADLVRLEQDIAIDISQAAGQVETSKRRVAATRNSVELAQAALNAEEKKLAAGSGRTLDVLSAQETLAQVQSSYARAVADERRARANYERELGTTLTVRNITVD